MSKKITIASWDRGVPQEWKPRRGANIEPRRGANLEPRRGANLEPRRGANISAQGKRSAALGSRNRRREALKGRNSRACCGPSTVSGAPPLQRHAVQLLSRPFRALCLGLCKPRAALRLPWADMLPPLRGLARGLICCRALRGLARGLSPSGLGALALRLGLREKNHAP